MDIAIARAIIRRWKNLKNPLDDEPHVEQAKGFIDGYDSRQPEITLNIALIDKLKKENEKLQGIINNYVTHGELCILTRLESGEPTADGGYRQKFAGKWYKARPMEETPKCNGGLEEFLRGGEPK